MMLYLRILLLPNTTSGAFKMRQILLLAFLLPFSTPVQINAADDATLWQATDGFDGPESAYYDAESGYIFLSHVAGGGGDKDGKGWISKLTLSGEIIKLKWFEGLNSPKGLRSYGGTLWVSDIDRIIAIDIATGNQLKEVQIKGAVFLNDLATGPDGSVYVADMVQSAIYRYKDDELTLYDKGEHLEHPNGLLVVKDTLYVGAWGTGFNTDDFSTKVLGRFYSINIASKKKTLITSTPTGHLDGVEEDGKGGFLVTDWVNGKLFHINRTGTVTTLQEYAKGVADLAYLPKRRLLLLPHMMDNTLTAFRMRRLPRK